MPSTQHATFITGATVHTDMHVLAVTQHPVATALFYVASNRLVGKHHCQARRGSSPVAEREPYEQGRWECAQNIEAKTASSTRVVHIALLAAHLLYTRAVAAPLLLLYPLPTYSQSLQIHYMQLLAEEIYATIPAKISADVDTCCCCCTACRAHHLPQQQGTTKGLLHGSALA